MDLNEVMMVGRLGQDAKVEMTAKGLEITKFSIANNAGWGQNKSTRWFDIVMFGERGKKISQYLVKGKQVVVVGEIRVDEWEKDGIKRKSWSIVARDIQLLGGGEQVQAKTEDNPFEVPDGKEVPF